MKHEEEPEPRVQDAMQALAAADREVGAPPQVEARLRSAFRNRNRKRKMSLWIPIAAAAVILLGLAITMKMHRNTNVIATHQVPAPQLILAIEPVIAKVAPARQIAHVKAAPKPQEIVTDFFPLPSYAPADDADGAELLRVTLPAAAMREVGLPVREERLTDRVQADVLVSHGVARAVRFVRSE